MRLVRLVNELEKLLAAENPQIKLNKTVLETGKLLSSIQNLQIPIFKQNGVKLNIVPPQETINFRGDLDKVTQILTNVVNNALKYTPEGGTVTISAVRDNEMGGFEIRDEGIGMAAEDLPHIFERFYRGDKSRARKTGGVGVGLSIVKALVEAHKGIITVESELDAGTTFTILFPLG
jgi:signal transduction histidine kinase